MININPLLNYMLQFLLAQSATEKSLFSTEIRLPCFILYLKGLGTLPVLSLWAPSHLFLSLLTLLLHTGLYLSAPHVECIPLPTLSHVLSISVSGFSCHSQCYLFPVHLICLHSQHNHTSTTFHLS